MSTDAYGQWMGIPMDNDDIESVLTTEGFGILSMAQDDEPYSLPISFGYDGERLYFALIKDDPEGGTKFDFIKQGHTARLLVTNVNGRFDWQSVAVTGQLRRVADGSEEWEVLLDALEDNGWFSREFERADSHEGLEGWELEHNEIRGLEVKNR